MCGIAGVVSLRDGMPAPTVAELEAMAGALRHRGPDEFGVYRDRRAGLAHARLAIVDLATGQQPLSNEDETLWVAFNGEVFNYVELREDLVSRGHRFRTRSDTEVIVHAYEEWGAQAFERFNGQWAVALWDSRADTLTLARDPYGICPLYVCEHRSRLYFASEVKAIFAGDPAIPRELDAAGLAQVFTFWSTLPPRTVFRGVRELEPGVVEVRGPGATTRARSWVPTYPETPADGFQGTIEDAVERVREALERATRVRMLRADVPVGSYLSGGLDSSLLAALALEAKGAQFATFSLRFADAEYDETQFQRAMVERLGSDHHDVVISRDDIATAFPEVIWHAERPVLRTAPAPLFLLSRLVRQHGIKVVLTGEGADEMFAGYDLFREAKIRRFWARQPDSTRRPRLLERLYPYLARSPVSQPAFARRFFGQGLDSPSLPGFGHEIRWRAAQQLQRLFNPDHFPSPPVSDVRDDLRATLPPAFGAWTTLAQDQYIEVRTLLSGYLLSAQGDRMLMAHSVEGRLPFLDREVAALADSLPPRYKLRVLDEKHVLKRAGSDLVPPAIRSRKKQPYRAPDALAFGGAAAREWVREVTDEAALADAGVFAPGPAAQLLRKCQAAADAGQFSNADNMAVVGILSTQLLHAQFVKRAPATPARLPLRRCIDRVETATSAVDSSRL